MTNITPLIIPTRDYGQEPQGANLHHRLLSEQIRRHAVKHIALAFANRMAEQARIEGNTYFAQACDDFREAIKEL